MTAEYTLKIDGVVEKAMVNDYSINVDNNATNNANSYGVVAITNAFEMTTSVEAVRSFSFNILNTAGDKAVEKVSEYVGKNHFFKKIELDGQVVIGTDKKPIAKIELEDCQISGVDLAKDGQSIEITVHPAKITEERTIYKNTNKWEKSGSPKAVWSVEDQEQKLSL